MSTSRFKAGLVLLCALATAHPLPVDAATAPTGQRMCYDERGREIVCSGPGTPLGGQDAYYGGQTLRYRDNGDGSVTDLNTGLMWQQALGDKVSHAQARSGAAQLRLGGHADWRLPTIKELYTLMDFSGAMAMTGGSLTASKPFLDAIFEFRYGDPARGERPMDAQYWSDTAYAGKTMRNDTSVFGVNFADGRIKSYPRQRPRQGDNRLFVRYVRGDSDCCRNDLADNGDGTITDRASGLMWMQVDSGHLRAGSRKDGRMDWVEALAWAAQVEHAGHSDWRLPNAKELQGLADYRRGPQATGSAAISPLFRASAIRDEGGGSNYGRRVRAGRGRCWTCMAPAPSAATRNRASRPPGRADTDHRGMCGASTTWCAWCGTWRRTERHHLAGGGCR